MKELFASIAVFLVFAAIAPAQDQSLQLIYISKDYTTKTNHLVKEVQDIYSLARQDRSQAVIFYMPDWESPVIVKINLPGANPDDIDKIYSGLMTKSETNINAPFDVERISGILLEHPVQPEKGRTHFHNVELRFYVTPSFWDNTYNEQIIAALWFILEFDQPWAKGYADMTILHQDGDGLVLDSKQPFGQMDVCKNYFFQLLTY